MKSRHGARRSGARCPVPPRSKAAFQDPSPRAPPLTPLASGGAPDLAWGMERGLGAETCRRVCYCLQTCDRRASRAAGTGRDKMWGPGLAGFVGLLESGLSEEPWRGTLALPSRPGWGADIRTAAPYENHRGRWG